MAFVDPLFWWTGAIVWTIAAGAGIAALVVWGAFYVTAFFFMLRVARSNIRWHEEKLRKQIKNGWVFFRWACKQMPDAIDVETDEGWKTIYWPGQEPCVSANE